MHRLPPLSHANACLLTASRDALGHPVCLVPAIRVDASNYMQTGLEGVAGKGKPWLLYSMLDYSTFLLGLSS